MAQQNQKRLINIDLLRVFAILCVVLNHGVQQTYSFGAPEFAAYTFQSRLFAYTVFTLGRMGVPCFLTISGYLLLSRTYSQEQAERFWKQNWFHLVVCVWVWFAVYDLVFCLSGSPISPGQFLRHLLFLEKQPFSHVWYMPMIIGIYLLIPVLANGLNSLDCKKILWVFGLCSLYAFGVPCINLVREAFDENGFASQIDLGFSGGVYGLYLLMGCMVKKGVFRKIKAPVLGATALVCFIGTVWFQMWRADLGHGYRVWYDFPSMYIIGICLLELFDRIRDIPASRNGVFTRIVVWLSQYSFSVYLIHNIFLRWLVPWGLSLELKMPAIVALVSVISCVGSFLGGFLIARIPRVGPYLLYIKHTANKKMKA